MLLQLGHIISSTFLSDVDVDMKNLSMLGEREQPKYVFMVGESQEALNRTYVKARKSVLFKEDGSDARWVGFG